MNKSNYYIAIVPDKQITDEIRLFQKIMSRKFDSHRALKNIPHITLVPPFSLENDQESELVGLLIDFAESFVPFNVRINNFSHFKNHTIFIQVEVSQDLVNIRNGMMEYMSNASGLLSKPIRYFDSFVPHITVGYRDLRPTFKQAWNYFKDKIFTGEFICRSFCILKHNGERWEVIEELKLSK